MGESEELRLTAASCSKAMLTVCQYAVVILVSSDVAGYNVLLYLTAQAGE